MTETSLPDGIYFDLDEDDYHAIPRLSASGIKSLIVSPATFWARSWMNTEKESADNDTPARILGRAYHCAVFEPEEFNARYCRDFAPEDYPDALQTDTAVCKELESLGETQRRKGESALERAHRLLDAGFPGEIASILRGAWEDERGDRIPITAKYFDQIGRDMARLADSEQISQYLRGGWPEVSILFTNKAGVQMKARLDYLTERFFVDGKTFDNVREMPVREYMLGEIRYKQYYRQGRFYQAATMAARSGRLGPGASTWTDEQAAFVERLYAEENPPDCVFFFMEKSGIPNMFMMRLRLIIPPDGNDANEIGARYSGPLGPSILAAKADAEISYAVREFIRHREIYGDAAWRPLEPVGDFEDADFNDWFLNEIPR